MLTNILLGLILITMIIIIYGKYSTKLELKAILIKMMSIQELLKQSEATQHRIDCKLIELMPKKEGSTEEYLKEYYNVPDSKEETNQNEWIAIRKFLPDGTTEINLTIPKVKRHEYDIVPVSHCNTVPCSEKTCEPTKPKKTFKRPDVDPTLWRAKFDEMLADKAKTLKSDNKVFADHHIDRQRFKALATPEQRTRHAELQVLCKAKGREKIAETMGRGAKKKG